MVVRHVPRRPVEGALRGHHDPGQRHPGAVLAEEAALEARDLPRVLHHAPGLAHRQLQVVGVHEVQRVPGLQLLAGPPDGRLPGGAEELKLQRTVGRRQQVGAQLEEAAEGLVLRPQLPERAVLAVQLQRRHGLRGEQLEQRALPRAELTGLTVDHAEGAEHMTLRRAQRHAEVKAHARHIYNQLVIYEARVLQRVGHQQGRARLHDVAAEGHAPGRLGDVQPIA